ncbi:unnamed protein product [Candida verbasci]|uniref:Uncharacterized protein n=1 Tax=Candida verbasci TaxID=1227364 RepID=A0A9W4TVR8_9ASCO|nr:unnamed protein product [Candida verbasci]
MSSKPYFSSQLFKSIREKEISRSIIVVTIPIQTVMLLINDELCSYECEPSEFDQGFFDFPMDDILLKATAEKVTDQETLDVFKDDMVHVLEGPPMLKDRVYALKEDGNRILIQPGRYSENES